MNKINLDKNQLVLLDKFMKLASEIKVPSILSKFSGIFSEEKKYHGIYLYGSVGRGKTMLMRKFYDAVSIPKKMVHYQQFMQNIHKKMHSLQNKATDKLVQSLASDIASQCDVLCMDEFEIKDITDAMIIMRLFEYLQQNNVFIFITTNTKPDNLYKDGLQRSAFLPFISKLKKTFEIFHLDTEKDYRFDIIANVENRILFPINKANSKEFTKIKSKICKKEELSQSSVEVFGRELIFKQTHNNILVTDFAELFERDLGYGDYVAISKKFEIIILSSVRAISEGENNIATRFINFIDNAYFNRVLLFIEIDCSPEGIYIAGSRKAEFKRTISRLNEMNSKDYSNIDTGQGGDEFK